MLSDVRALLPLAADCEITLEANPGTFEADTFRRYRASGVNRLSIGIQSFDDAKLQGTRPDSRSRAGARAIDIAQRHFDNFNLDLMYALPDQSLAESQGDVEHALAARPPHLSLYQLTLEPNTVFAKYPPALPDDDTVGIDAGLDRSAGRRRPVTATTKCRPTHARATSAGTTSTTGSSATTSALAPVRTRKISFPASDRAPSALSPTGLVPAARSARRIRGGEPEVARDDLPFEFMLNAMRLADGVPSRSFSERTGLPLSTVDPNCARRNSVACWCATIES